MFKILSLGIVFTLMFACSPKEEVEYRTREKEQAKKSIKNDPGIDGSNIRNPFALEDFEPSLLAIGDVDNGKIENEFFEKQKYLNKNFTFFYGSYRIWKSNIPLTVITQCGDLPRQESQLLLGESFKYFDILPKNIFIGVEVSYECKFKFFIKEFFGEKPLLSRTFTIINDVSQRMQSAKMLAEFQDVEVVGEVFAREMRRLWGSVQEFHILCSSFYKNIRPKEVLDIEGVIEKLKQRISSQEHLSFCRQISVGKDYSLIHRPIYRIRPKFNIGIQFRFETEKVGKSDFLNTYFLILKNRSGVKADVYIPKDFSQIWRVEKGNRRLEGGILRAFHENEIQRDFKLVTLAVSEKVELQLNYVPIVDFQFTPDCYVYCDVELNFVTHLSGLTYVGTDFETGHVQRYISNTVLKFNLRRLLLINLIDSSRPKKIDKNQKHWSHTWEL